jgi:hypothetical protein
MIRFILRFIGLWILAVAFVALIRDGTKTIAGSAVAMTRLRDDWNSLSQGTLERFQSMVEKSAEWLWNPVMRTVLEQPSWLVLGIIGCLLVVIGRKKKPLIGYTRD